MNNLFCCLPGSSLSKDGVMWSPELYEGSISLLLKVYDAEVLAEKTFKGGGVRRVNNSERTQKKNEHLTEI